MVLVGGLMALVGLPVPPAGGQEGSVRLLRASPEPLLSIGVLEGAPPYELFNVDGAVRLSDGSVVAVIRGNYEVRAFGPDGQHLWSKGRLGEGPGEFQGPQLLPSCTSDEKIVVYDRLSYWVTVLDREGELVDGYRLRFGDRVPYSRIECSPSGRMVFSRYADRNQRPSQPGPYRWTVDLAYLDGEASGVTVFRTGVPGADRVLYFQGGVPSTEGPQRWGRDVVLAPVENGVWMGTGDGYEIELVDWTGAAVRRIRWAGPNLDVTKRHIDTYHDGLYRSYERRGESGWRERFRDMWSRRLPTLPAYTALAVSGDWIWVREFRRPGESEQRWLAFDSVGTRVGTMVLPYSLDVQQLGPDWVLAVTTDQLDVEKLVVYALVEGP